MTTRVTEGARRERPSFLASSPLNARAHALPLLHLAPVVQTLDSAIHRIKIYPLDGAIGFRNTYPLDSDLSGG